MSYTLSKTLTFAEFLLQYLNNLRYELADGEPIDMEPTGPHETVSGKLATQLGIAITAAQLPWFNWIVDYRALGGRRYIGSPKVPTVSVYVLVDGVYQVRQFRAGDVIASLIFPDLRLTAAEILMVME